MKNIFAALLCLYRLPGRGQMSVWRRVEVEDINPDKPEEEKHCIPGYSRAVASALENIHGWG